MDKSRYIVPSMMLLLLSSCGLYSKYERQPLEYSAESLVLSSNNEELTPLASMSWRELLTDAHLSVWIDSALSRNTDLRIAQLKVDEAKASLTASKLAFLPSLNLDADARTGTASSNTLSIGPSAAWEIDIFGKQRNLKRGAEAAFYASKAYSQAVQTSLVASVADGYYTLLMLDEQLQISERTLKTWDENIRTLRALKRAGRTNEAAVLQAEANRMKVENSVLTLRKQILVQENAIRSLMLNPDMDLTRGTLSVQQFPNTPSKGVSVELLSNRPDVRQAEYQLQKTFYSVNVARAAFYPSLTLSGNAGWTTTSGSSVADPSSWVANALGSLTAPIFNRGTNLANLKIANAECEIATLEFQQKLLDAGMEVNNALATWQTAQERLTVDRKQIETLEAAVRHTQLLMRNSNTNYLEVLTAQQRLLDAELTEANDRYDVIQSIITLYRALGGGVQ